MSWMWVVLVAAGYLLGSIPFGLIVGRIAGGVDVRDYGSGKTGMTNTLRTLGLKAAAVVLAGDLLKGVLPVLAARLLTGTPAIEVVAALAAIAGHNWPVFAGFRGGRGVATSVGALLAMALVVGLAVLALAALVLYWSRYVSLMSITAAVVAGLTLIALALTGRMDAAYGVFGAIGAPLVVARHRDNISRLLAGAERKLGDRGEKRAATASPGRAIRGGR